MKRPWRASVLDAVQRLAATHASSIVTRQQLIRDELPTIIAETQTKGLTPHFTLSYELQQLRDTGFVEFLGHGRYRLLKTVVDAETFVGNDIELDAAIHERRLRIGRVEVSNELALYKRRKGQQRLRRLALDTYGGQCALCDLKEEAFLVTSHIVPWSESEDARGDLCNVVILCKPHDSLFEFAHWSLDKDLTIVQTVQRPRPWVIQALLPQTIVFRSPESHLPSEDYLQVHRHRHKIAVCSADST